MIGGSRDMHQEDMSNSCEAIVFLPELCGDSPKLMCQQIADDTSWAKGGPCICVSSQSNAGRVSCMVFFLLMKM